MNRVIFGDAFEIDEVNGETIGMRVYTHPVIVDGKVESAEFKVVLDLFDMMKAKLLQFNDESYHGVYHLGIFGEDCSHYVNLPITEYRISDEDEDFRKVTTESIQHYAKELVEFIGDCQYGHFNYDQFKQDNFNASLEGRADDLNDESIVVSGLINRLNVLVSVSNESTLGKAELVTEELLKQLGPNCYIVRPYSEEPQYEHNKNSQDNT